MSCDKNSSTKQELYEINDKIRSGGFGVVFKGTRKSDNLKVAIKLIRKKSINLWSVVSLNKIIKIIKFNVYQLSIMVKKYLWKYI